VIVVDASVAATALLDDHADGGAVRARLRGADLGAPELVDLEVLSVIRRLLAAGQVTETRAAQAVSDLRALPIARAPHRPLLRRCWELRNNLSAYDASYVALAEALDSTLVTGDARLAQAPGLTCDIELLSPRS
jgi:predicted nucleic acid-binding protein